MFILLHLGRISIVPSSEGSCVRSQKKMGFLCFGLLGGLIWLNCCALTSERGDMVLMKGLRSIYTL